MTIRTVAVLGAGTMGAQLAALFANVGIPVLLLDDVSSELDPERAGAVYRLLDDTESQVFLTTTRPEVIGGHGTAERGRREFVLSRGTLGRVG